MRSLTPIGEVKLFDKMSLATGTRLGPYEILAPLGAGGMGEVYRARDTKLKREVAIKVLPESFAADPERMARFQREAEVLASLNHPNIAQIYGVEERALVMELVEGENLKGPLPVETALAYATQIADALEAAHEKGIVHRDLKPANVKVTPEGVVKVLDFGLAKAAEERPVDPQNSPTMTISPTRAGMILGTAAYMAPEQARGRPVDKRADIWAFGCVLYEMLTGKQAFTGETTTDILAAVVKTEPDLTLVPVKVRPLLRRCLEKDPKKRLRDISGVELLLEEPLAQTHSAGKHIVSRLWIIASALSVLVGLGLGAVVFRHSQEAAPRVTRLSLATPEKANFNVRGSIPQISPDGQRVVFAPPIEGKADLWVRDLDSLNLQMLPGTSGASYPFWSPDSKWVGFFTENKLKKINVTGGPPVILCDVVQGRGGTWSQDGVIVYASYQKGLFRVSAAGGTPTLIHASGVDTPRHPWFLPDGRHFLYSDTGADVRVDNIDSRPETQNSKEVLAVDSNAVYVPPLGSSLGYLLFVRERTLVAQPFDAVKIQLMGDPVSIAEHVALVSPPVAGQFSASQNGTLVYAPQVAQDKQLTWFDREGRSVGNIGMPAGTLSAVISPDGLTIAADQLNPDGNSRDVWLHDLTRGTTSRLTFIGNPAGLALLPLWSPDGSQIVFNGNHNQPYVRSTTGAGPERMLQYSRFVIYDWSRDGRWLIAGHQNTNARAAIWAIPQFGDQIPVAYLNGEYNEGDAKLSPNSHLLAYSSDESKRREIFVQAFPEHGGKWQISTSGGDYPVWGRDGRELYYVDSDRRVMAVEVRGDGKNFTPGLPKTLFELPALAQFDVSKDARFLIQVPMKQGSTNVLLTVVTNWQASLKK